MNNKLYDLRKSFVYAFRGIVFCVRYERNMRIHMVLTAYIIFFALFFSELWEFTRAEFILLLLTCVLVMSLEIVNTAIEVLTDKASPEYSALAKAAKDAAAGAVLLSSAAAVIVAGILFWDVYVFREIWVFFTGGAVPSVALAASIILSFVFIFTGKERRKRGKREKN